MLLSFQNKLEHRINKFNQIKFEKKTIIFLRIELNNIRSNYIVDIDNLLVQLEKYTDKFKLVLILNKNSSTFIEKLDSRIIIHYFDFFDSDWKMNKLDWKNILFSI